MNEPNKQRQITMYVSYTLPIFVLNLSPHLYLNCKQVKVTRTFIDNYHRIRCEWEAMQAQLQELIASS
jgi:hypothetical protein